MARDEHDREDLLREATAYAERMELRIDEFAAPVFVGFRPGGAASFYFGPDPVFHFNAAQALRRAYVGGLLYRAERGQLARLRRERTASESLLIRSDLSNQDSQAFLADVQQRLAALADALDRGAARLLGQAPATADVIDRTRRWLANRPAWPTIAKSPSATAGRRE